MPEKSETRQHTSAVGDGGAEHTGSKFLASTLENSFILVTRVILFGVMEGQHGSGQAGESVLKHRFKKVTRWCAVAWYTRGEDFTKSGFNPELNRRISVLYWSSVHQSRLYQTFLHQTCNDDKVPIYCERFSVPNLCTTALVPGRRVSSLGVNTVTASLFSAISTMYNTTTICSLIPPQIPKALLGLITPIKHCSEPILQLIRARSYC